MPNDIFPVIAGTDSSVIAAYDFDDATNTQGDSDFDLTASGAGVTFTAGHIGNAAKFDGVDRLTTTAPGLMIPSAAVPAFTVCGWAKFDSKAGNMSIVSRFVSSGTRRSWAIQYVVGTPGTLRAFWSVDGTSSNQGFVNLVAPDVDVWFFFAVRFDGTTADFRVNTTDGTPSITNMPPFINDENFTVGAQPDAFQDLVGQVDLLQVFNIRLTDLQITDIYNGGVGQKYGGTENIIGLTHTKLSGKNTPYIVAVYDGQAMDIDPTAFDTKLATRFDDPDYYG
jgi:hypothetical protein